MAGRGHGDQTEVAKADLFTIGDHPADICGGEGLVHAGLRVVLTGQAGAQHRCRRRGSHQRRPGQLLEPRHPADMIEMLMAHQQVFYVLQLEAERADIGGNQVGTLFRPGVDQDMALAAGHEDRGNAAGADQIGVGVDSDRRRRLVPIGGISASGGPLGPRFLDRSPWALDLTRRLAERYGDLLGGQRQREEANEHSSRR